MKMHINCLTHAMRVPTGEGKVRHVRRVRHTSYTFKACPLNTHTQHYLVGSKACVISRTVRALN